MIKTHPDDSDYELVTTPCVVVEGYSMVKFIPVDFVDQVESEVIFNKKQYPEANVYFKQVVDINHPGCGVHEIGECK